MKKQDEKISKSEMKRDIKILSIPIMVDLLFAYSIPAVDSFFLSKISLQSAIAVGALAPIIMICDVVYCALNSSVQSLASQAMGKSDKKLARSIFNDTLLLVLVVTAIFTSLFFFFSGQIVSLIGLETQLAVIGEEYLFVLGCGIGFLGARRIFLIGNALFGIVKFNMFASLIMLLTNVIGNSAIVNNWFGLGVLGVSGIALTSVIAFALSLFYLIIIQKIKLGFTINIVKPDKKFIQVAKRSAKIAIPSLLDPLSTQIFLLILMGVIANMGESELAIRVFSNNLFLACLIPCLALSITSHILTGKYIGSKDYWSVDRLLYRIVKYSVTLTFLVSVMVLIFGNQLVSLFTSESKVLSMVFICFIPIALAEPIKAVNMIVGANLKSTGDGFTQTFFSLFITWFVVLPIVLYLSNEYGIVFILWVLLFDEFSKCLYNCFRWAQGRWRNDLVAGMSV